jgi:hypothetical protein
MAHDLMYECDVQRQFQTAAGLEWRWKKEPVEFIADGNRIRCTHCHGAVRVHRQRVAHGPADHVEHLSRADSTSCRGGHYFDGTHRMSSQPVA